MGAPGMLCLQIRPGEWSQLNRKSFTRLSTLCQELQAFNWINTLQMFAWHCWTIDLQEDQLGISGIVGIPINLLFLHWIGRMWSHFGGFSAHIYFFHICFIPWVNRGILGCWECTNMACSSRFGFEVHLIVLGRWFGAVFSPEFSHITATSAALKGMSGLDIRVPCPAKDWRSAEGGQRGQLWLQQQNSVCSERTKQQWGLRKPCLFIQFTRQGHILKNFTNS